MLFNMDRSLVYAKDFTSPGRLWLRLPTTIPQHAAKLRQFFQNLSIFCCGKRRLLIELIIRLVELIGIEALIFFLSKEDAARKSILSTSYDHGEGNHSLSSNTTVLNVS
jgi:hypothetical protein